MFSALVGHLQVENTTLLEGISPTTLGNSAAVR
jgi:hypothetical protein